MNQYKHRPLFFEPLCDEAQVTWHSKKAKLKWLDCLFNILRHDVGCTARWSERLSLVAGLTINKLSDQSSGSHLQSRRFLSLRQSVVINFVGHKKFKKNSHFLRNRKGAARFQSVVDTASQSQSNTHRVRVMTCVVSPISAVIICKRMYGHKAMEPFGTF
ncbi:hypothetical protein CA13_03630 [Planctomycetes bacterium CA13]|uniref:Uncharacterized protein n=1 Tax=Novipirellula herctigrandis TaxID=2527986 RepID=A0A5C5YW23_9BACT|nr:hypothetical protein CA13_03630 [Planctomycetes bacterium CA13]